MKIIKNNPYTLIELVAVLAIIILISSVVTVYVRYTPSFVTLDAAVNKIEGVLQQGAIQALSQGRQVAVTFNSEDRKFQVSDSESPDDDGMEASQDKAFSGMLSYTLSKDIEVEFQDGNLQQEPEYLFFPDGSASGPDMLLSMKGHTFQLRVSPLTGTVRAKYVDKQ